MGTLKNNSRLDFNERTDGINRIDELQIGCLQRIADAVEKLATSYDNMRNDRDYYKRIAEDRSARIDKLKRSNAALRGVIKRKKRS